jgi:nucleotide-binding universal stress UspA family protein
MKSNPPAIVVGVDGSDGSKAALGWAVRNCVADETVHVVHAFSPIAELALAAVQQDWLPHRDHVTRELEKEWVAEAHNAGVTPYTSVVDDNPVEALLARAETVGAELIVVGRHGSGKSRRLGTVARGLLHALPVPIVFASEPPQENDSSETGRVVVCVGYGRAADSALGWASRQADAHNLILDLVHVVGLRPLAPMDSPSDMLASYLGPETSVEWAREELEDKRQLIQANHPELTINCEVSRGSVVKRIIEHAKGAELVVLGEGHTAPFTRNLWASRTMGIIAGTDAPVAVVPA